MVWRRLSIVDFWFGLRGSSEILNRLRCTSGSSCEGLLDGTTSIAAMCGGKKKKPCGRLLKGRLFNSVGKQCPRRASANGTQVSTVPYVLAARAEQGSHEARHLTHPFLTAPNSSAAINFRFFPQLPYKRLPELPSPKFPINQRLPDPQWFIKSCSGAASVPISSFSECFNSR